MDLKEPTRHKGVVARVHFIALGLAVALGILVAQLWNLQVVQLPAFQELAEGNRVWEKRLKSDRGVIYARNGEVLADNRASADVVLVPGDMAPDSKEQVCAKLSALLGVTPEPLLNAIEKSRRTPFEQILVKQDVTKAERIRIEEHAHELRGVFTVVHPKRRYHYGETGGQMLGYLGEINESEMAQMRTLGYSPGDLIGRDGVERVYEDLLHGRDGFAVVTKFASGRPQIRTDRRGVPRIAARDSVGNQLGGEERREDPAAGDPLHLTLDMGLQAKCEDLLRGQVGSIVVLNAETGEVLAMASVPTYDPSVFVGAGRAKERLLLLNAPEPNPMFNRSYRENYPPGSVFKVMLAAAALEEGIINENTTHFCPGGFKINGTGRTWRCHKRSGHGTVNVYDSLMLSCDVYFYNVGLKLGIDKIAEWSNRMGLGVKTGIDLPSEVAGLVPTREWKQKAFANAEKWYQQWYPGDTVNVSIGQGSVDTTPLQNAVMMACILNGGRRVTPYLNMDRGPQLSEPFLSENTLRIVQEGMRRCVEDPARGTGRRSAVEGMKVIGKTGTAQIMLLSHHEKYATEHDIPYDLRDHAWYVAGVLDRSPRIAICILVEHGHHGSTAAAPLTKGVVEYFYRDSNIEPVTLAQGGVVQ